MGGKNRSWCQEPRSGASLTSLEADRSRMFPSQGNASLWQPVFSLQPEPHLSVHTECLGPFLSVIEAASFLSHDSSAP